MSSDIFDSSYVDADSTFTQKRQSEFKKFLKQPVEEEDIKKYGSSKPKRIVIKAKIKNG